jgi:hypothetical protein
MGFPHPTQFGLGDPQLGLLPVHACWANNESLSLWDMPLKLWAEFAEVNAMGWWMGGQPPPKIKFLNFGKVGFFFCNSFLKQEVMGSNPLPQF